MKTVSSQQHEEDVSEHLAQRQGHGVSRRRVKVSRTVRAAGLLYVVSQRI